MEKIVLYSTGCPRCHVLKAKLDEAKIKYELVTDVEVMLKRGFRAAPVLEVDGDCYDFVQAVKWLKERGSNEE